MTFALYVANLPLAVTEEEIRPLFEQYGEVVTIQRVMNQRTEQPREAVRIDMADESAALQAIAALNGYQVDDHRWMYVTPAQVFRVTTSEQDVEQVTERIASELSETEKTPRRQIYQIIELAGVPFTEALLEETRLVEADGGIMTSDGERKRTLGGVFFLLAKKYLAGRVQRPIFYIQATPKPKQQRPPQQKSQGQGKKSGPRQRSGQNHAPSTDTTYIEPEPPQPQLPLELTPEVQQQFDMLIDEYQNAKERLQDIQSRPPSEQTGLFTATKEVWKLESQIKELQSLYPDLSN